MLHGRLAFPTGWLEIESHLFFDNMDTHMYPMMLELGPPIGCLDSSFHIGMVTFLFIVMNNVEEASQS